MTLVTFSLFYSCTPREMSVEDLNLYVSNEKNGLHLSHKTQGVRFDLTYRPTDILVSQSLPDSPVSMAIMDSLRRKFSGYHCFILSLSHENRELLQPGVVGTQYSDLLQLLSFRMANYVRLRTPNDTLSMADYQLDHTFAMSTATRILFVFEKQKQPEPWLQFTVDEFGLGTGPQHFKFSVADIERVPSLRVDTRQ